MSANEITITLSDKDGRLNAETLALALTNALELLHSIEAGITDPDVVVRWDVVRAQMRSPFQMTMIPFVSVRGRPRPAVARRLVKTCLSGVRGVERGTRIPSQFGEDSLDATRKLMKTTSSDGTNVTFSANGDEKIVLTDKAVKHLEEIASKARHYVDFTTIEGTLEAIWLHEQNTFYVWETLTNNKIECIASEEQVKQAVGLLKKRVAVTGRVHYRNHKPTSIRVEEPIRVLRDANNMIRPSDIGPVNITDGLSSEEHVWRMRNA